jgi:hypothetical protein
LRVVLDTCILKLATFPGEHNASALTHQTLPLASLDEDTPRFLIFVDILGFKAITNRYRVRVQHWGPGEDGFTGSGTTEMQNRINSFDGVLSHQVREATLSGGVQAMLFSDCAFLVYDNVARAVLASTDLMRDCIRRRVPVRMGIGKGTFYDLEFSLGTQGASTTVSKSRFIGTAVVNAHEAEQSGGKGMRIFLHPSMEEELSTICQHARPVTLARPLKGVRWELSYLYKRTISGVAPTEEVLDRELFENVASLMSPEMPRKVLRQYKETLSALSRMRKAEGRTPTRFRTPRYGTAADAS